jgi:hypothetical protein
MADQISSIRHSVCFHAEVLKQKIESNRILESDHRFQFFAMATRGGDRLHSWELEHGGHADGQGDPRRRP